MLTLLILAFTLISAQSDLDVGKKALLKQDYSAAIKAFTQSIEKEQTPTNLGFRATAFLSISKHANAISDYSLILKLKPDHKQTLINRANAYLAIGLFDNAIEDAVSLNDDSIFKDATSAKADYLRALKSACPDAISLYSNILLISPFFVDARMKRADCYISTNELEMAIGDFSRASNLRADNTEALYKSGLASLKLGEVSKGFNYLKECVKLDQAHKECRPLYTKIKKFEKEFASFIKYEVDHKWASIIDKHQNLLNQIDEYKIGNSVKITILQSTVLAHSNLKSKNTLSFCNKLLEIDEFNKEALMIRAELLIESEDYEAAMRDYKNAHEHGGENRASEGYNKAKRLHAQASQKNYYKVLGVDRTASKRQIKKAYYKLAQKWHPDKNEDKDVANKKYTEITEAYDVLKDDELRARFDNGDDPNNNQQGNGFGGFQHPFFQQGGHTFHFQQGGFPFNF